MENGIQVFCATLKWWKYMSLLLVEDGKAKEKAVKAICQLLLWNDIFDRAIKLEFVNRKRISVLKLKTENNKSFSPNKGFAYILDAIYNRISSGGLKQIILGDMNADTMRLEYTNDRVMASWLKRHSYTEIRRLFVQAVPNSFLNSKGRYSWIDHFIINWSASW
jgi:hypothetical protein